MVQHTQTVRQAVIKATVVDRTDTVLTATHVSQGEIDVSNVKSLTIYPMWTKGDETSAELKVTSLHVSGGVEHQLGAYTNASGTLSEEAFEYQYDTASTNAVPIELNVSGLSIIKIYVKATAGTPTGKMKIDYVRSNAV